ncbi:hypothetical protein OPT61_g2833 [Boeremia exigua]|uniref:Uncharacterized protein n=1 Tax=Boeremia exigua TaxID=749465 RepID=A0ACC2IK48_9PLEO|nr:hypothetical protein OPT61_g2833 [Boeremia exigua]
MIVAILGATGQQGGSVASVFLEQPLKYHVRALTRNVHSPGAKALEQRGAEVVAADLNDMNSLARAFEGANVIYAMTDFWQEMSFDIEYKQGTDIANIAVELPSLVHFIWASLPDGHAISEGKFKNILHWQSKAAVTDYIRSSKPALWEKTTAILFPNYFENCKTQPGFYLPKADGVYVRSFPLRADTPLPNVAISDTGILVQHVIEHGNEYCARTIAFYSEAISELEKLNALAKYYSIPVRYEQITEAEFRASLETKMPPISALDFTEQLMIFDDCGMIYARPEFLQANEIKGLTLKTWEDFIRSEDLLSSMQVEPEQ